MAGKGDAKPGVAISPAALRQARLNAGVSLAEVAEAARVSKQAVWLMEQGRNRPRASHLRAIAEFLRVSTEHLIASAHDPHERQMADLEARQEFPRLEALARRLLGDDSVPEATHAIARYHLGRSIVERSPEEALKELRSAEWRSRKLGLLSVAFEAMDWQAAALFYLQDPKAALERGRKALQLYRGLADRDAAVESRMLEHIGGFLFQDDQYEEAIATYRQAIDAAGSMLNLVRLARIHHGLASSCKKAGLLKQALYYMERAVAFYATEADIHQTGTATLARAENTHGLLLMESGRLDLAEEKIRSALDHHKEAGVETGLPQIMLSMAELRQRQGNVEEATDWTHRAIQLAERRLEPISIAEGYEQLGELSASQRDWDRCEAAFSRAVEVLDLAGLEDAREKALAHYRRLLNDRALDHASGE